MPPPRLRGLYAITPDVVDTARLVAIVGEAIAGGAVLVQYRNKTADPTLALDQARALRALTRTARVPLIINDALELALAVDADGLHLGGSDGDLAAARAQLGGDRLLGASCYGEIERAQVAIAQGADHVAFGSMFDSGTKPGARRASLDLVAAARRSLAVPICAIGGITADNARSVIDAGADLLAVISAVFDAPDVRAGAQRIADLFEPHRDPRRDKE